jgi:cytoskeleton protein RodZ
MPDRDPVAEAAVVARPAEHSGAWLRREREARGIPLHEVALKTKIKLDFLRFLEEGRLDQLPAPVFVRGFVKAVALAIGANAAEASRRLAAEYAARDRAATPLSRMLGDLQAPSEGRRRFGVVLVVLVILIAATLTLSLLLRRARPSEGGLSQRAPASIVDRSTIT